MVACYLLFFLFSIATEHFLKKYSFFYDGYCGLVFRHSFDSDSRSSKYSADFLWALGSVHRSQALHRLSVSIGIGQVII